MLSRPMRAPSAATQLQESPCLPPVDWVRKCRAFAVGFDSSASGTCANADATAAVSQTDTSIRRMGNSADGTPISHSRRVHPIIHAIGFHQIAEQPVVKVQRRTEGGDAP